MDRIPESMWQDQLLDVFVTLAETYDLWPTSWCSARSRSDDFVFSAVTP